MSKYEDKQQLLTHKVQSNAQNSSQNIL